MQTLTNLVKAVLTNPDAYTDAFPVAETQTVSMWEIPQRYGALPSDSSWARSLPEYAHSFMESMAELTSRVTSFSDTPLTGEGAQLTSEGLEAARQRIQMVNTPINSYSLASRVLDGRSFQSYRWSHGPEKLPGAPTFDDGNTQFVLDDTMPEGEVRSALVATDEADRPTHRRVRDGHCACGFQSMFTGDINNHIAVS